MAKVELKAGALLDLLTPGENATEHEKTRQTIGRLVTPTPIWHPFSTSTDSSGNIGGGLSAPTSPPVVYRCPVGMRADLHRLVVEVDGYSGATPLTTGEMRFTRNEPGAAFSIGWWLPQSSQVAPVTFVEGDGCPSLNSGDRLVVVGDSLPHSVGVHFSLLVRLWPTAATRLTPTATEG